MAGAAKDAAAAPLGENTALDQVVKGLGGQVGAPAPVPA